MQLQKEKRYEFRRKLLELHPKDIRDASLRPEPDETVLCDGLEIVLPEREDIVAETAAKDFVDYLFTSMNVSARVVKKSDSPDALRLSFNTEIEEASGYMGHRVTVGETGITVEGYDSRGVAQGLYLLEDLMNIRKAPYLKRGVMKRKSAFTTRTTQSPYGTLEFPDEILAKIAHLGMDTVELWLKDFETDARGYYFDVNSLCERAERYGLKVMVELYIVHSVNAKDPGAEEFYDGIYGELFRNCPKVCGVEFLGEATHYKSYDPHVTANNRGPDYEKIPFNGIKAGWWPCDDYPELLNLIKKIIRKVNPDADIILHTYNWTKAPSEERVRLINELSDDIIILGAWDMFQKFRVGKESMEVIADYSLRFPQASDAFRVEAEAAHRRGMRLLANANSSGMTWDFGMIPYEPAPYQWIKKYQCLLKAAEDWGLCGMVENIHYGFYPSIINDIEKWMFFTPLKPIEETVQELLVRDYGSENAGLVDSAFHDISEAITHYIPTNEDQYGAFRIGPAFPFWSDQYEGWPDKVPTSQKHAAHKLAGMIFSMYWQDVQVNNSLTGIRIYDEIDELGKMDELILSAIATLEKCTEPNEAVLRLLNMVRFMHCNIVTVRNLKKHFITRQELSICRTRANAEEILNRMEAIVRDELANVESAIPLVQVDSRLGWEPSMEYVCDEKALRWKVNQLRFELDTAIPRYRAEIFW